MIKKIDGKKTLKQIIDELPGEKMDKIFDILYKCTQHGIIIFDIRPGIDKKQILLGDMLTAFSYITQAQLEMAIQGIEQQKSKLIGEVLINFGFLTKDNVLNILKFQLWYKKFFDQNAEKLAA